MSGSSACEGTCDPHVGAVERVRVMHIASMFDWGVFWYCQEAIAEDGRRGMRVTRLPPATPAPERTEP